jgi:hypothetical protein
VQAIGAATDTAGARRNSVDTRLLSWLFLTSSHVVASFLIDGEAIVTNGDGLAVFDLIRHKRHGDAAVLCAFDLICTARAARRIG